MTEAMAEEVIHHIPGLTQVECRRVLRLMNQAWERARRDRGLSQRKAENALGVKQSAISQYLRGVIPLNLPWVLKVREYLADDSFSRTIEPLMVQALEAAGEESARAISAQAVRVPVVGTTSGCEASVPALTTPLKVDAKRIVAVEETSRPCPSFAKFYIVDRDQERLVNELKSGDSVAIFTRRKVLIGEIVIPRSGDWFFRPAFGVGDEPVNPDHTLGIVLGTLAG